MKLIRTLTEQEEKEKNLIVGYGRYWLVSNGKIGYFDRYLQFHFV